MAGGRLLREHEWMSAAALVGFVGLLTFVFGLREVIHRRHTGETSWRRPPSTAAWIGDAAFAAGVLAAIAGAALALVDAIKPIEALDRLGVEVAGAVLLAVGGVIAALAPSQMGASWRAGIDLSGHYDLVRDGLFRLVRNPFYLGMILAVAGVALMTPNILTGIAWVCIVLGCEIDVRAVEEPHLAAAMGNSYRDYAATTGRFVPRIGRLTRS